jgi:hypothetical protein
LDLLDEVDNYQEFSSSSASFCLKVMVPTILPHEDHMLADSIEQAIQVSSHRDLKMLWK